MRLIEEATELFETERREAENGQSNLIYVKTNELRKSKQVTHRFPLAVSKD